MKFRFFLLFMTLLCSFHLQANSVVNAPIAIHTNDFTTVSLFFPSKIIQVVSPSPNFLFSYEPNGTMGTLKARQGAPSNLTVITDEGRIYSFLLTYSKEVSNFTFVLSVEEAIGMMPSSDSGKLSKESTIVKSENTKSVQTSNEGAPKFAPEDSVNDEKLPALKTLGTAAVNTTQTSTRRFNGNDFYEMDKEGYYEVFCENNYLQETNFEKRKAAMNRIELRLNNLISDRDERYFVMEIQNNSWSDYSLKGLRFYVKSLEVDNEIQIYERFMHKLPETVPAHTAAKLVFVCKNFKLATGQKVYILLEEKDGKARSVMLPLDAKLLNRG